MTTMTDLLLPRGSTKNKEQVQKLLESQPAVKKDRAGSLPGRGVVSRLGCRAGSKTGWGAGGGSGPRTWKLQKRSFTSTRVIFLHFVCIFFCFFLTFVFCIFFAFPRLGVIFWACFLHFPNRESFFGIFFAFPRPGLPPSPLAGSGWENDKNMSRFWTFQLGSGSSHPRWMRKRQENDKQMTPKWQQNGRKMTKKWQTNDTAKQEWQKNDKTKRQKKTKK